METLLKEDKADRYAVRAIGVMKLAAVGIVKSFQCPSDLVEEGLDEDDIESIRAMVDACSDPAILTLLQSY